MKKIISAALVILMLIGSGSALTYSAINNFFEYTPPSSGTPPTPDTDGGNGGGESDGSPVLVVPAYKDYGRGTVDFDKVTYKRPDIEAAIADFDALCELIQANEVSFADQLSAIQENDDAYFEISTMYAYANIMTSKNTADENWSDEYAYISVNYPRFSQAVENLFVSCAQSVHAESFESEYFGDGLVEDYADGGSYSDAVVALMAAEAELEAEYSALSMSTVKITHNGTENTAAYFVDYYYDKYGKNPLTESTYVYYTSLVSSLYYTAYAEIAKPIYVNLLKTRRLIADELSLESYTEHAYEASGHDYSAEQMEALLEDIATFVMPLYYKLYTEVFSTYAAPEGARSIHKNTLLNNLYTLFYTVDDELEEAYSYMLQHKLFDIEKSDNSRFSGAFTTYLDNYNAPFVFASTSGYITDYFTVIHEFGHFFDSYINNGGSASLDLAEISSQALELLAISRLDTVIGKEISDYLLIRQLEELLATLRLQGVYAMFEHEVYQLAYDDITEENIAKILAECEEKFLYPAKTITLDGIVNVPHIMLYPTYVQSYCTSALVSLEIYFAETDSEGAGLAAYKELVSRSAASSFIGDVTATGLESPFGEDFIKSTVNRIHRLVYGTDYFKQNDDANAA